MPRQSSAEPRRLDHLLTQPPTTHNNFVHSAISSAQGSCEWFHNQSFLGCGTGLVLCPVLLAFACARSALTRVLCTSFHHDIPFGSTAARIGSFSHAPRSGWWFLPLNCLNRPFRVGCLLANAYNKTSFNVSSIKTHALGSPDMSRCSRMHLCSASLRSRVRALLHEIAVPMLRRSLKKTSRIPAFAGALRLNPSPLRRSFTERFAVFVGFHFAVVRNRYWRISVAAYLARSSSSEQHSL